MTDDTLIYSPTQSDNDGHSPTGSDAVRQGPTASAIRSAAHTLTTREVMKIFEEAGVPRAQRSIERYCKGGDLDCQPDVIEKRLYITRESVDILIGQLKEIAARHQKGSMPTTPPSDATTDDTQRPPATTAPDHTAVKQGTPEKHEEKHRVGEYEEKLAAMEARIKELENEKFTLEIDKRSREQIIGMMREQMTLEVQTFTAEITKQSRRVGQLETEMRQIQAPDRDRLPTPDARRPRFDDPAVIDAEYRDADEPTASHHDDVSPHAPQP